MSLIEVLFALVILSGVMLSLSRFGQSFTRASRDAAHLSTASDLAAARLEVVRRHPTFATVASTYSGASETSSSSDANPSMLGYPGFVRVTAVTRDSTAARLILRVTVTVTSPSLGRPVAKTAYIAPY